MNFPSTKWGLLTEATLNGDNGGRAALEELCRRYYEPVRGFFRERVSSPEDVADLTQSLFEELIANRGWMRANAGRGRFRSFLLGFARNVLRHWRTSAAAEKRGGKVVSLSLEMLREESLWEPVAEPDGEARRFDCEWAQTILRKAWQQVEEESLAQPDGQARFGVLRRFLPGGEAPPGMREAAEKLGITEAHMRLLVHRLRESFRQALRREIADTVLSFEEVEEELAYLGSVMSVALRSGAG
jgi:RNA polymerase sigma-70 factor (ECF subfamily)